MENNKYAKELEVGVKVVQMACSLCKTVQKALVSGSFNQVKSKNDDSPVTVAGNLFFYFKWVFSDCLFLLNTVCLLISNFLMYWVNFIVFVYLY